MINCCFGNFHGYRCYLPENILVIQGLKQVSCNGNRYTVKTIYRLTGYTGILLSNKRQVVT
jgi:hypothetical protein